MAKISFAKHKQAETDKLVEQMKKFSVFNYLLEDDDRGVTPQHLVEVMKEMNYTSVEEFAEACDEALALEIRLLYPEEANPYGLLMDGNSRKKRCEVRND